MEMADTIVACFGSGAVRPRADDDLADLFQNISEKEISEFGDLKLAVYNRCTFLESALLFNPCSGLSYANSIIAERLLKSQDAETASNSSSSFSYSETQTSEMDCSLNALQPTVNMFSSAQISATNNFSINFAPAPSEYFNVQATAIPNPLGTHGTKDLATGVFSTRLVSPLDSRVVVYINPPSNGPDSSSHPSSSQPSAAEVPAERKRRSTSVCSRTSSSTTSSTAESTCPICEAPAAGRHFGIECCGGCKAFFRRAIRLKKDFKCKFSGKCNTKRGNGCKGCRLRKCFAAGMNKNNVQKERDKISRRTWREESKERSVVDFSKQFQAGINVADGSSTATLEDVANYLGLLTPKILCWAKEVPGFEQFSEEDQSALINLRREIYLVFEIAMKSLSHQSALLIGEKHVIGQGPSAPLSRLGDSISREILGPIRDLKLDGVEFTFLNSILLFDATSPWIADKSLLQKLQVESFVALRLHVANKHPGTLSRFENISSLIDAFNLTALEFSFMLRKAGLWSDPLI